MIHLFVALIFFSTFFVNLTFAKNPVSIPVKGRVLCMVSLPQVKGLLTLSATIEGKKFEKKIDLPSQNGTSFSIPGTISGNIYVVEVDGEISSENNNDLLQKYRRNYTVKIEDRGNSTLVLDLVKSTSRRELGRTKVEESKSKDPLRGKTGRLR